MLCCHSLSSTMLKRSVACILAILIVTATADDAAPGKDENMGKLRTPITVRSKHLVEWKEVPLGSLLFQHKPNRIGHTGNHCNSKDDNRGTAKMGIEANATFKNEQYCSLRPEYLLEVENIEETLNLGNDKYTRLLKFKKEVTNPETDVIVMDGANQAEFVPAEATGEGYVTVLDPGFVVHEDEGLKLKGKMHHRFMQHSGPDESNEGYWANYKKYSEMMLSKTIGAETNGDDLYIKKPLVRKEKADSVDGHIAPLFALGELHKEDYGVTGEKILCGALCTAGKHILVEDIGHRTFEANLFISKECDWMEVCFSVDTVIDTEGKETHYCGATKSVPMEGGATKTQQTAEYSKAQNRLQIVFRYGIVKMPYQRHPFVHDFHAIRSHADAFRLSILRDSDSVLALTTESRERMVNIHGTSFSSSILFSFSDSKCIHHKDNFGGLISGASLHQYQLKQHNEVVKTEKVEYLGEVELTETIPKDTISELEKYESPTSAKIGSPEAHSSDKANVYAIPGKHEALPLVSVVVGEGGWQTWMIFFGFLSGSFTGVILAAMVLFFLRRSVYDAWYRGMFKRYHCDPSSNDGGMTGTDFGNTTGPGSQMSTVQSQMSTIGATSGMDTTGGGGKTGGDMVTM